MIGLPNGVGTWRPATVNLIERFAVGFGTMMGQSDQIGW
jgi:hypothetical protein